MSHLHDVLKEPLQELFRKYAFLDLEVCPGKEAAIDSDFLCVEVSCDEPDGGIVVMVSPELAALAAANIMSGSEVESSQPLDVVCEMANILAGHVYEIVRAGQRPRDIGVPRTVDPKRARGLWQAAGEDRRLTLRDETGMVGGVLITLPQTWTAWA